jgi:hypothetical protein
VREREGGRPVACPINCVWNGAVAVCLCVYKGGKGSDVLMWCIGGSLPSGSRV